MGVVTRAALRQWLERADGSNGPGLQEMMERHPITAYPDEPLRVIVYRMAQTGFTRMPVVSRQDGTLVGMLSLSDLLSARARTLDAEHRRERVLGVRLRRLAMFRARQEER